MENPLIKGIRDNWMILAFIVGLIMSSTAFNSRLTNVEAQANKLETANEEMKQMHIDIAVITSKVENIEADTSEIKKDLKDVLNRI